jgi:hypothetical protein
LGAAPLGAFNSAPRCIAEAVLSPGEQQYVVANASLCFGGGSHAPLLRSPNGARTDGLAAAMSAFDKGARALRRSIHPSTHASVLPRPTVARRRNREATANRRPAMADGAGRRQWQAELDQRTSSYQKEGRVEAAGGRLEPMRAHAVHAWSNMPLPRCRVIRTRASPLALPVPPVD